MFTVPNRIRPSPSSHGPHYRSSPSARRTRERWSRRILDTNKSSSCRIHFSTHSVEQSVLIIVQDVCVLILCTDKKKKVQTGEHFASSSCMLFRLTDERARGIISEFLKLPTPIKIIQSLITETSGHAERKDQVFILQISTFLHFLSVKQMSTRTSRTVNTHAQ